MEIKQRNHIQIFEQDESVRLDVDLKDLGNLPSVFQKEGTVTAGNACPMSDGAAALLLMSKEKAEEKGLKPLLKVKAFASAGVDPSVMGIGPVPATLKVLGRSGLTLDDIGLVELNEAFAGQALAVISELKLNRDRVNVNGGAIALGHPVGATGAKLTVTLMHEMLRSQIKYGIVTLCMAGGMGLSGNRWRITYSTRGNPYRRIWTRRDGNGPLSERIYCVRQSVRSSRNHSLNID